MAGPHVQSLWFLASGLGAEICISDRILGDTDGAGPETRIQEAHGEDLNK